MKLQQLQIFQNLTEEELEKKSCLFTGCSKENIRKVPIFSAR